MVDWLITLAVDGAGGGYRSAVDIEFGGVRGAAADVGCAARIGGGAKLAFGIGQEGYRHLSR